MSRTNRTLVDYNWCFRKPQTKSQKTNEEKAYEEIKDAGYNITSNRLRRNSNPSSTSIPTDWDDIVISAYKEVYRGFDHL